MWLRRDSEATALSRILHRRIDTPDGQDLDETEEFTTEAEDLTAEEDQEPLPDGEPSEHDLEPRPRRSRRAAVIARRRRRTSGLVALTILATTAAVIGLAPLWIILPPAGLLAGHLALLRVAVNIDAVRAREAYEAYEARQRLLAQEREAEALRQAEEEEAAQAEIIDLGDHARSRDVFDQYAPDDRRAVGD
jgi:hypothetical protein